MCAVSPRFRASATTSSHSRGRASSQTYLSRRRPHSFFAASWAAGVRGLGLPNRACDAGIGWERSRSQLLPARPFDGVAPVSYTHLRAHETSAHL
eukprot:2933138-Alexandrium_andersonii.AAC.1